MARAAMPAEDVEATRTALLDVAQNLYETGGPDAMSFRAIATEYGCSNTMPYSYFGSKADIVDGLRIRAYEWLRGELEAARASADDPTAALEAIAGAYVESAAARPRMYELLYSAGGALDETDDALIAAKRNAIGVCRHAIEAAATDAQVELRTDAETAAHVFWVAAHGLVSLEAGGFLVVGRTVEDLRPVLFGTLTAAMTRG